MGFSPSRSRCSSLRSPFRPGRGIIFCERSPSSGLRIWHMWRASVHRRRLGGAQCHHRVPHRADAVLVRLNLLLLMVVSFLPFPTRLLAEYTREKRPERVAATIYGITLLVAATIISVLWRYAVRRRLVHPDAADTELQMITKRLTPSLAGYVALSSCLHHRSGVRQRPARMGRAARLSRQ